MIYPEGFIRLKIRFRPKMAKRSGWMIYPVDDITGFYCTGDELLSFLFVFFVVVFFRNGRLRRVRSPSDPRRLAGSRQASGGTALRNGPPRRPRVHRQIRRRASPQRLRGRDLVGRR